MQLGLLLGVFLFSLLRGCSMLKLYEHENDGNIVVSNALRAYLQDEGVYIEATERTIIQGAI